MVRVGQDGVQVSAKAFFMRSVRLIKNLIANGQVVLVPDLLPQATDDYFILLG